MYSYMAWGTLTNPHLRFELMTPFFAQSPENICINKAVRFVNAQCESVEFVAEMDKSKGFRVKGPGFESQLCSFLAVSC